MNQVTLLRLDHVAIAVRDYDKAHAFFTKVFGAIEGTFAEIPGMNYYWKNYALGDLSRLELLAPTGPGSFLDGFLKNREGGVHHMTFQTPDIQEARASLEANGIPYFGYNEYVGGVWKELFIHPRDAFGVLIQIAEFTADDWLAEGVKLPGGRRFRVEKHAKGAVLTMEHPGGGMARFELSSKEVAALVKELS
ncbi:MAG: hypothetical protein EPN93_09015 [Spirochaetes bacterium]|nr:MAG: hypothetical protein EPN93_09015 [Spirochaetota bacterium]